MAEALPRLSDPRRPPRSQRPLRLPCPGRAARASVRGPGRDLRRSRSHTSALRPAAVEMSSPTRTSRFGPTRPTALDGRKRVTERARVGEQFPPALLFGVQMHAADRHARLVRRVGGEHERGHAPGRRRTPARSRQRDHPAGRALSRCAAYSRAPRGPPRIATKKTPRPRRTQKPKTRRPWRREHIGCAPEAEPRRNEDSPPLGARKLGR